MTKWIEEALQAPRDAIVLLLGAVTAFSIFSLLRHEFASEPLRVVLQNWTYWSHTLWNAVGALVRFQPTSYEAGIMTSTALIWLVHLRGYFRGQTVQTAFGKWGWVILAVFVVPAASYILLMGMAEVVGNGAGSGSAVANFLVGSSLFLLFPLGTVLTVVKTPRSFFGVVIAGFLLLLIDRIPILPAATAG